jgi:hypothetical protein
MELQAAEERTANWSRAGDGGSDDSLRRVVLELGIHRNEARAAEHEDFISTINKQVRRSILPVMIVMYVFADSDLIIPWSRLISLVFNDVVSNVLVM